MPDNEAQAFAEKHKIKFLETSAKSGENIQVILIYIRNSSRSLCRNTCALWLRLRSKTTDRTIKITAETSAIAGLSKLITKQEYSVLKVWRSTALPAISPPLIQARVRAVEGRLVEQGIDCIVSFAHPNSKLLAAGHLGRIIGDILCEVRCTD